MKRLLTAIVLLITLTANSQRNWSFAAITPNTGLAWISWDSVKYYSGFSGTGFIKASGTTISFDNSTYATTSTLSSYMLSSAFNSTAIATALGYTPYNGTTNPNGFLTSASLSNYLLKSDTAAMLSGYLRKSDTATMLLNYARKNFMSGGTGISYNAATGVITNTAPDQTVTLTAGNRISVTGTYPNFTIAFVDPTINYPTRTINTNYTISATKQAEVKYSVVCSVTNPLLAGSSTANAFLEYSIDNGSNWTLATTIGNASTVGVAVAIQITNGQTVELSGTIPANASPATLTRIRTTTTGTASVSVTRSQETY